MLLLLLLPTSGINAQEPTNTPEPVPLYLTPTPLGTLVPYRGLRPCPDGGVPAGWGTVTPSPRWLMECAHCVPADAAIATVTPLAYAPPVTLPTPGPTIDLWATPSFTVTPGVTGTPTSTPTPTPTPVYEHLRVYEGLVDCSGGGSGSLLVDEYGCIEYEGSASSGESRREWTICHTEAFTASVSAHVAVSHQYAGYSFLRFNGWGNMGAPPYLVNVFAGHLDYPVSNFYEGVWKGAHTGSGEWFKSGIAWEYGIWSGPSSYSFWACFNGAQVEEEPEITPTPGLTPTPTPTPQVGYDYCYTVEDIDSLGPDQGLPSIGIGYSTCYGTGAINFELPIVGEVSIPAISVCFDRLTMGEVQILGVSLDMDVISSAIAAVAVIRLLFRS